MSNLKKNIAYNMLYQVLLIFLPLITAPYISRVLGVEGVGTYSYIYSIAYYFGLCGMLGVSNHGNRSIALAKRDKNLLSRTFWNIYFIQLMTTSIALALFIVYVLFFSKVEKCISLISILFVISYVIDINWFFFGMEQFKMTVTRNTIIKLLTVICIFIFVKKVDDLWKYVLIMSTGMVLSQVYLWLNIKKYVYFVKPTLMEMKKNIQPMLILFIPVVAYSIYKVMDKIMLGCLSSIYEVGLYENADKIINIPIGIITAFGTVMMPRISSLLMSEDDNKISVYLEQSFKYFSIISIGMTFGLMGISTVLAPVYFGNDFIESAPLIAGLSVTIIFMTWANIIRTQYLIPNQLDKVYVISTIVGAIVNLLFNLTFIPILASKGALIGTVLAEFSVFIVQAFMIRKDIPIFKYISLIIFFLFDGMIMAVIIYFIGLKYGNTIPVLIVQVLVGSIIYCLLGIIFFVIKRDKDILYVKQKLIK